MRFSIRKNKNEEIIKRQQISTLSHKALLEIAQKSKYAVLAEKFLLLSFQKNKTLLAALQKREKKNKLFYLALSAVPLASLLPFFIPDLSLLQFLQQETSSRLFVGLALGLIISSHLIILDCVVESFLITPVVLYIVYCHTPEEFFSFCSATPKNALPLLCLPLAMPAFQ